MKIFEIKNHQLIPTEECYTFPELKVLIDRDKSKDKIKGFKDVGFVFHMCDPKSSFFNYPHTVKEKEIIKSYIQDPKFKQDKEIKAAIIAYKKSIQTSKHRMLEVWNNKLDDISDYVKDLDVDENSFKELMDAAGKIGKIVETIDKLEQSMEKGKEKQERRGNQTNSLLEEGDLE